MQRAGQVAAVLLLACVALAGKHIGEVAQLEYEIVYKDDYGKLVIDESGETYYFNWGWTWHIPGDFPEELYGTYPVYFIGREIVYEIHLRNVGQRTFKNLMVVAAQEYLYVDSGDVSKGDPLPGESSQQWFVDELRAGDEVVLVGKYNAPRGTYPGLDRTHLKVMHWSNGNAAPLDVRMRQMNSKGRSFVDDGDAGVYCPPSISLLTTFQW